MDDKTKKLIDAYVEKYGGFPYFLFMGAEDDYIAEKVLHALETGHEIEIDPEDRRIY